MPERPGSRFLLEALFLVALAVALAFTHLDSIEIVGAMLLGWLIVALLEWATWREEPHYASGLPPRYYVPRVNVPAALPLEQVATGYPESARDEAPTWIASPKLRAEVLGDWPLVALPEREPLASSPTSSELPSLEPDPWLRAELPVIPLEPHPREPERELEPEAEDEPEPEVEPEPARTAGASPAVAWHTLDPLADAPRRRWVRRGEEPLRVRVSARPAGPPPLPGAAREIDEGSA